MADTGMPWDDASSDSEDLLQRVMDLFEDLLVTVIEGVRERPQVAAAIAAAIVGAAIGAALAGINRPKPRPKPASSIADMLTGLASAVALEERSRRVTEVAGESAKSAAKRSPLRLKLDDFKNARDLVPVVLQLVENPIVRGYIRSAIRSQLKKRAG